MCRPPISTWVGLLLCLWGCRCSPDTPLTIAASAGDLARVQALLGEGVSADEKDSHGWTALQVAARNGRIDVIRVLIERGADPNLQDSRSGWTPLLHAIHKRRSGAVHALVEAGANVNGKGRGGTTPLMMASGYGSTDVVRLLLERGADPYAEVAGRSALWAAVGGGAIADITDGPPLGSCFPDTVAALLQMAPDLKLRQDLLGRVTRWLGRSQQCREAFARIDKGARS